MARRVRTPNSSSSKATAAVLFIVLLPFAVLGLSWVYDYVSKRL